MSDAQIKMGYLRTLKRAFKDTPFVFWFHGRSDIVSDYLYDCDMVDEAELKDPIYNPGVDVLNVYICDPFTNSYFGTYGWSSLPVHAGTTNDGVVSINPETLGESVDPRGNRTFVE